MNKVGETDWNKDFLDVRDALMAALHACPDSGLPSQVWTAAPRGSAAMIVTRAGQHGDNLWIDWVDAR